MSSTSPPIKLVGVAEIARRLGVSRQAVFEQSRRPGFPEPFALVAKRETPLWLDETIEKWIAPRQWKSTNGGL